MSTLPDAPPPLPAAEGAAAQAPETEAAPAQEGGGGEADPPAAAPPTQKEQKEEEEEEEWEWDSPTAEALYWLPGTDTTWPAFLEAFAQAPPEVRDILSLFFHSNPPTHPPTHSLPTEQA